MNYCAYGAISFAIGDIRGVVSTIFELDCHRLIRAFHQKSTISMRVSLGASRGSLVERRAQLVPEHDEIEWE